MAELDAVFRTLDSTLDLGPRFGEVEEELYSQGLKLYERRVKIDQIASQYGSGAIHYLVASLTVEPHLCYVYHPLLMKLADVASTSQIRSEYDADEVVKFWRGWYAKEGGKPEYNVIHWKEICPRLTKALRAFEIVSGEQEMWDLATDSDPVVQYALARNPNLPEQIWSALALSPEDDIRLTLVKQRSESPLLLKLFAQDLSPVIRRWVAMQSNTPSSALALLAKDSDSTVRESLLNRNDCPQIILRHLLLDQDAAIKEAASKKLNVATYKNEFWSAVRDRNVKKVQEMLAVEPGLAQARYAGSMTPLHLAACPPVFETAYLITKALVANGANINESDLCGYTPLHLAASGTQKLAGTMVKFLIRSGANSNAKAANGETPVDLARQASGAEESPVLINLLGKEVRFGMRRSNAGNTRPQLDKQWLASLQFLTPDGSAYSGLLDISDDQFVMEFTGAGGTTHVSHSTHHLGFYLRELPLFLTGDPLYKIDGLNEKLRNSIGNYWLDSMSAPYETLYVRLIDVLRNGGVSALKQTAWSSQAADSVPFILHSPGMKRRLVELVAHADSAIAERARKLLSDIALVDYSADLCPERLPYNPLFVWGAALMDGFFTEAEIPIAAEFVRQLEHSEISSNVMLIGQASALAHLIAQFVDAAIVQRFAHFCALAGFHFRVTSGATIIVDYADPGWRGTISAPERIEEPKLKPILSPEELTVLPGRNEYLRYLANNQLSESAVLEILPEVDEEKKRTINKILMSALESGHERLVKSYEMAEAANTNVLLAELNRRLTLRISKHNIMVPEGVYVGVFPTNSFNACSDLIDSQKLILVNTGAFELLEALTTLFILHCSDTNGAHPKVAAQFIQQYCQHKALPHPDQWTAVELHHEGQLATHLTTVSEEFLVAHEYGHFVSGHLGHAVRTFESKADPKSWAEEFLADRWATNALTISTSNNTSDEELSIVCSGPLVFFAVQSLIEDYERGKQDIESHTHPPAVDRCIEIRLVLARAGFNRYTKLGVSFREFCLLVATELGIRWPQMEAPFLVINNIGDMVDQGLTDAVAIPDQPAAFVKIGVPESKRHSWWQFWK
jgi:hypothetical protein